MRVRNTIKAVIDTVSVSFLLRITEQETKFIVPLSSLPSMTDSLPCIDERLSSGNKVKSFSKSLFLSLHTIVRITQCFVFSWLEMS